MLVKIYLTGCHDYTEFNIECDEKEFSFLNKIAAKAKETSEYECMPTMYVDVVK